MPSQRMQEFLRLIEDEVQSHRAPTDFELAYQVRVALDRIRFAIKHAEEYAPHSDRMREAALQLLDALDRLESAERNFQQRCRRPREMSPSPPNRNGHGGFERMPENSGKGH